MEKHITNMPRLVAVEVDMLFVKVIPVLGKKTTDEFAIGLIELFVSFFHKHEQLMFDGEPATVALTNSENMARDLVKFKTTPKHSSASNLAVRGIQAVEEQCWT